MPSGETLPGTNAYVTTSALVRTGQGKVFFAKLIGAPGQALSGAATLYDGIAAAGGISIASMQCGPSTTDAWMPPGELALDFKTGLFASVTNVHHLDIYYG